MKFKKILCVLLGTVMAAASIASCGEKKDTAMKMDSSKLTGPKAYKEQIELKIPVYDRGIAGEADVTDNYWTDYVQKNFGDKYNIKMTFVPISRNNDVTIFNNLIVAGEQPDIIFSYDYPTIASYQSKGVFQPIDEDVFKRYAPTFYEKTKNLRQYSMLDEHIYFLTATRPMSYNWVRLIRTDWLEKAGLEMPVNREEFINVLRKFKELKLGGEGTIPYTRNLFSVNFSDHNFREYPLPEKDNAIHSDITVASLTFDATKKQLMHYNKLYNEGLISPEWYLDRDGSRMQADFVSGKAGVYGFYLSQTPPVLQTLMQNCPDAKVAVLDSGISYPEGAIVANRAEWPFGMISGISTDCKYPEAVLMYFEWLSKDENLFVLQNGIENVTYTIDSEIPITIENYDGEEKLNYSSNKDIWCLVTEGKDYGSEQKNLEVQKRTYAPDGFEDLIQQSYDDHQKYKEYMYTDFIFTKPIESLLQYSETLKLKWETIQVDLITCKPEDFEAKYEAACKEYLDAGYQAILDEKEAVYETMKE